MAINLKDLDPEQRAYAKMIGDAALEAGIPPDLAIAQAFQESRLKHFERDDDNKWKVKTSDANAVGLMQITPETAKTYDIPREDLDNPIENIRAGMKIMKSYFDKYGAPDLAVMAYHQGPGAVDKYLETNDLKAFGPHGKEYLKKIGENYDFSSGEATTPAEEVLTESERMMKEGNVYTPPSAEAGAPEKDYLSGAIDTIGTELEKHPVATSGAIGAGLGYAARGAQRGLNQQHFRASPQTYDIEIAGKSAPVNLEEEFRASRQPAMTAGDKWSSKVVGGMGPGGESVTEAARNYRMQQGLSPEEAARWRTTRGGIIEPNVIDKALSGESPVKRVFAENAMNKLKPFVRATGNWGRALPDTSLLSGVGAGINAGLSRERWEEGDPLGAAVAGINALSGTAAMLPVNPATMNPYGLGVKGAGMVGEAVGIPLEYAYEKWREKHPLPSIVKETLKKQKKIP